MDLLYSLMTQGCYQALHGIAAHNRVVYNYQAHAVNLWLDHVEFQVYFQLAQALIGFDKGTVAIAIFDDRLAIRNAGSGSIAQRRRNGRIWHRYYEVCIYRMFFCQLAPQRFTHGVDIFAV